MILALTQVIIAIENIVEIATIVAYCKDLLSAAI